jgi:GTP cyclohydrolase I
MDDTLGNVTKSGVESLLRYVEGVSSHKQLREGLQDTPGRVLDAYAELCSGYDKDPEKILDTTFGLDDAPASSEYDGLVALKSTELYSLCEHHLLPFVGTASLAYIPEDDAEVVGLSKLARLVDAYARRLQCQERLTSQIADAIMEHLDARGAICVIKAEHLCMRMRGVNKYASEMVTSVLRGNIKDDHAARDEALEVLDVRD